MSNIALVIGSKRHEGWTSIQVIRSMENISGAFQLTVTDKWINNGLPLEIKPNDACKVFIDSEQVLEVMLIQ
jgi:prophage tail gpP-like protein